MIIKNLGNLSSKPIQPLKKENSKNNVTAFLGLYITIKEGKFSSKLCNKKDVFFIVRLSCRCSNSPYKMFYSTISPNALIICTAISAYNDFLLNVHRVKCCMKKQGAKTSNIIKALAKTIFWHTKNFLKDNVKHEHVLKA